MTIELTSKRCKIWVPSSVDAPALLNYVTRNREHLEPWEPKKNINYFTNEYWSADLNLAAQAAQMNIGFKFVAKLIDTPDKDPEKVIAACNFTGLVRGAMQACYLGYSMDKDHQGQGLMSEIIDTGIEYMFSQQKMHRIMASHLPENRASEAILKKLGFEKEGYAKDYLHINGQWRDHVLNSKLNPKHPFA